MYCKKCYRIFAILIMNVAIISCSSKNPPADFTLVSSYDYDSTDSIFVYFKGDTTIPNHEVIGFLHEEWSRKEEGGWRYDHYSKLSIMTEIDKYEIERIVRNRYELKARLLGADAIVVLFVSDSTEANDYTSWHITNYSNASIMTQNHSFEEHNKYIVLMAIRCIPLE